MDSAERTSTVTTGLSAAALSLLVLSGAAQAQATPPVNLYLDTGGHLAFVKDMVFTPDGELLLSASDDKTIRVWDWRSGVTLRRIGGQIGAGNEGKMFALDVSPDSKTVAAGGWFAPGIGDNTAYGDIRIFELATGRISAVLKGLDYPVYDLDFSPDGSLLAAGGQDGFVQLWRRNEGGWATYETLDADARRVERVSFALGGQRLAAATSDNGIRLFDMATLSEISMPEAEDQRDVPLSALAVSPDGAMFATGNAEGGIHLWNATDGALVTSFTRGNYVVGALTFTADGQSLVAGCAYRCDGDYRVAVWDLSDPTAPLLHEGHDNTVLAASAGPDAAIVATAGGERHEIHLWDPSTGKEVTRLRGIGAPIASVGITDDGGVVAWGTANPCPGEIACPQTLGTLASEMLIPTADRGFENPSPLKRPSTEFQRAVFSRDRWSLRHAPGGPQNLANAVLEIVRGEDVVHRIVNDATNGFVHSAYTLLSDGVGLVTGGSDGTLIHYDRESGTLLGEFRGHAGQILAIAEAPDAGLLVTGSSDQTLRLWNLATRQLIVTIFAAEGEWIVWTPQGYFHSSPKGDEIVGWTVSQGSEAEARYLQARQLRQHLSSPEIVRRAIIFRNPMDAARELRGTDSQLDELLRRRPPEFEIRVADTAKAEEGFVTVEIVGAAEAGADVSSFSILSNDRRIDDFAARAVDGTGGGSVVLEIPVQEGENRILISGVNEFGYITERGATVLAPQRKQGKPKGKLYVAAIGVNEYPHLPKDCSGRACDLRFPVADASEFLRVVTARTAPLHAEMEALLIVNRDSLEEDGTRAAEVIRLVGEDRVMEPEARTIRDELIDFLDLPGPDDTTILFIAGHGINVDEEYYVIPSDGRKQDEDRWRRSSLVAWSDIHEAIERAKGRRFMLIDTCHAANAFNPTLEKDAADARIVVLAATAANNTAAELAHLGHGAFTFSVLEGLRGKANTGGDGVRILGLSDFVDREVRRLTDNRQEPFYHLPRTENFLVAAP